MAFMMPMFGIIGVGVSGASSAATGMSPVWGVGIMLLFFLILFGAGYVIYRSFTRGALSSDDPALEELRLEYARGDLSQEEFEQRQEDLRQS